MIRSFVLALGIASLLHSSLIAQDDEFKKGLIGTYTSPNTNHVQRVDPDIAFQWEQSAPHPQIGAKDWKAEWTGQVLLRSLTPYQFHAQVNGSVTVLIDDEVVLKVESNGPQWLSGEPVKVSPGFQDIKVKYEPGSKGAELKLFWSSEEFDIEPIPSHQFFHEEDDSEIQLIELGRQHFDAKRCANCHREEKIIDRFSPAPPLWGVTSGTNPQWIVDKLLGQHPEAEHDQMPNFGFTKEQAEDIAAYLHRLDAPFDLMTSPDAKPKKGQPNGEELFNSLGCLACHQVDDLGTSGPFSGTPLTNIGNKRSADWLATWLTTPDRLNPVHRMPEFKLSRTERGLLAEYLSTLGKKKETKFGRAAKVTYTESTIRGQALVKEFQCANCHKIPAIEATNKPVAKLTKAPKDLAGSCLSKQADQKLKRPRYLHLNREAITAYLNSLDGAPSEKLSMFEQGQRVLERRQCLACHSRSSEQGLKAQAMQIAKATPSLQNQTQLVIPPSLNAVGDKLQDSVLDVALSGKQDRVRANWLKVQMPTFVHSEEEIAALKHYLIEHDRLPPEAAEPQPELKLSPSEALLVGRKLVGAGGWSCIACHQIGDYTPKNTALGTRGSDLMAIGKRLRPEFYYRWAKSPIRIIPGMEMPSFTKPVPGVLNDDPHQQLAAIFAAVNDPNFEPPTNPSQVEQLWQVAEGESPRIVRDVFTVGKANGDGTIARAFAVGFDNQHGMLIDLDQMAVRDWGYGDFARQRTVGKSWFWDLAGASVARGFNSSPDLVMITETDGVQEFTPIDPARIAHATDYKVNGQGVELNYELQVKIAGKNITIPVREEYLGFATKEESGWQRTITPSSLPDGIQIGFRPTPNLETSFQADIQPQLGNEQQVVKHGDVTIPTAHAGESIQVFYKTTAKAPRTQLPERQVVLPTTDKVTTFPGHEGTRLPIPTTIMPTALALDSQGRLLVTSLKGDVYRISDSNNDGLEEKLELIAEGLSAPFGVVADGNDVLVAHKPELLRLIDGNNDGIFEKREIPSDGWGHSDNYHDWVSGPVFDKSGSLFVATGSDYSQPKRDRKLAKWRGKIVRAGTDGQVEAYAHELRYPIGIATDAQGRIFVSDQQGVQNTFNEINHIVPGGAYGVPGQLDGEGSKEPRLPAVQIPHPWTRSVNGIFFLPENTKSPFAGHGVGCEYNQKFLVRFSMHEVDGELQGACYPLTKLTWKNEANTFLGPIAGVAAENGEIYIGSIYDSGWLGGPNVGEVVKLKQTGEYGNGIREIRAIPGGFEIDFISKVDAQAATNKESYSISGYTRVWQGSYATDDSGRYSPEIEKIELSEDGKSVTLYSSNLKPKFLYEFNIGEIGKDGQALFPSFGAYSMNRVPTK